VVRAAVVEVVILLVGTSMVEDMEVEGVLLEEVMVMVTV
jgi:hypothetical protein